MRTFFTEISWYWLVLVTIISIVLSFWLYYKDARIEHLKKSLKVFLGALRFLSFFFIGVLIIGILFEKKSQIKEKPLLIFNVDNSTSMLNYKDSAEVIKVQSKIDALKNRLQDKYDFVQFPLAEKMNFSGSISNLSRSIKFINENYSNRNLGAVVSVSDGNYNEGLSPVFEAEKLKFVPFYVVGVGDTLRKKDQLLESVKSNKIAFLGNQFPIEYYCSQFGYNRSKSSLKVYVDGELKFNEEVTYGNGAGVESKIELQAKKTGVVHIRLELVSFDDEYTLDNNSKDVYIEVLDSRSKVVMVSGAPNPDVGMFRNIFKGNSGVQFNDVLEIELNDDIVGDLYVLHNVGKTSKGQEFIERIEKEGKNYLYIAGVEAPANVISKTKNGVVLRNVRGSENYLGTVNDEFKDFVISEKTKTLIKNLPPLKGPNASIELSNSASVMLNQRVGNLQKKEPLVVSSKQLQSKQIMFLGEGLWKWRLFDFKVNKSFELFDGFMNKIVQYLIVKENKSKLQVFIDDNLTSSNTINIGAEFYNDAYELINDPIIAFKLVNENNEEVDFEFLKSGNGYFLNLGKLKGGKYNWEANCSFNKVKHVQNGTFVVESKDREQLMTRSNFRVLNDLANMSNGTFLSYDKMDQLYNLIENDENITSTVQEERSFVDLLDYLWLVFLILGLLTIEWFIRKFSGTY